MNTPGFARRGALVIAIAAGALLTWAAPAQAHVEIEADKPQAGATDVTVTFVAESESTTAGVASMQVFLPDGIPPSDVSYLSGPDGWSMTMAADGYTVSGPAVPAGGDVTYQVKIAKLPLDSPSLPFKTLQVYTDGRIDRWIDLPTPGVAELEHPAPILEVSGAITTTAPATTPAGPTASSQPASSPTSEPAPQASTDSGSSAGLWIVVGALVVLAAAAGAWWLMSRRRAGGSAG